jgi:hypothetical protein
VQLLKNFPAFYGTRRFITVFTRALHWSLSCARSIQYIPSHPISLRSILILSTHLRLGLQSCLFPSGFSTKILNASSSPSILLHVLPISYSLTKSFYLVKNTSCKAHIMQFSPTVYHFIPLRSKYSPQHPALKHPQVYISFLISETNFNVS